MTFLIDDGLWRLVYVPANPPVAGTNIASLSVQGYDGVLYSSR